MKSVLGVVCVLFGLTCAFSVEHSFTEYQVKALFLLNFTKYVEWPAASYPDASAPFIIGIYGQDRFGDALTKVVEGKTSSGHRIIIRSLTRGDNWGHCHILFISESEKHNIGDLLDKVKTLPVLTVGETDRFMEQGGVIKFVNKQSQIRLEINLEAARQAQLQLSSQLLSVADIVKGK